VTATIIYITRPLYASLAAKKKISLLTACLKLAGYNVIRIPSLATYTSLRLSFPFLSPFFLIPFAIWDLISTSFLTIFYLLTTRGVILTYNILIDTSLLACVLARLRVSHILQIEESQTYDPLSHPFNRYTSFILQQLLSPKLILANKECIIPANLRHTSSLIFPGINTASSIEPHPVQVPYILNNHKPNPIRILYSARIDEQRGFTILPTIIKSLYSHDSESFQWHIFGYPAKSTYASDPLLNPSIYKEGYLNMHLEASTDVYLSYLRLCDIALNITLSADFELNSLPSKLIEYVCSDLIVISSFNTSGIVAPSLITLNSSDPHLFVSAISTIKSNINKLSSDARLFGAKSRINYSVESYSARLRTSVPTALKSN